MAKRRKKKTDETGLFDESQFGEEGGGVDDVALHEATEERYLNYALSVITSRALPDVRDGLKPVQRRILFAMNRQGLRADSKHRKCATVVGDVMGSYHPHGDSAIYEALVRLAQPFVMRVPLIDPQGNFGTVDGDAAAAMRYTECRMGLAAAELVDEISERTVDFRPNYDGSKSEPIVLPARLPNLLINGSIGIAVGMATNIPPHNPIELIDALKLLLDDRSLSTKELMKTIKGPDFPTAGRVLNSAEELVEIYEKGHGSLKVRGTYQEGDSSRASRTLIIDGIPYGVNKSVLVERIAEAVVSKKLPQLLDVRDVSKDDVRIELELKKDADEQKVLGYLYRNTPLQTNFALNLTCLIPTDNPEVCRPDRIGIKDALIYFLDFRFEVVTRKLENELRLLNARIHVLEGFELVFDALDEILAIIRASDGKQDAANKIMARFSLDAEQTEAILELKLYRLAKLEILVVQKELDEKRKRRSAVEKLLEGKAGRWKLVDTGLSEVRAALLAKGMGERLTIIEEVSDEPEFTADDFIVEEDCVVVTTRDGWVKRQTTVKDLGKTKLRRGDEVLSAEPGSTRATLVFFSSFGAAYTARFADISATTGHGDPIQKQFRLKDGERIVAVFSLDPRRIGDIGSPESQSDPDAPPPIHAFAATSDGYALRFGLGPFVEPSTRAGRRYARPNKDAEVIGVSLTSGVETVIAASAQARAMLTEASLINFLAGPGKGVRLIKLDPTDRLLGFILSKGDRDLMVVETNRGAEKTISTAKYEITNRGGRGREIMKQGAFTKIITAEPTAPEPFK